jgi:hypothetical protein
MGDVYPYDKCSPETTTAKNVLVVCQLPGQNRTSKSINLICPEPRPAKTDPEKPIKTNLLQVVDKTIHNYESYQETADCHYKDEGGLVGIPGQVLRCDESL